MVLYDGLKTLFTYYKVIIQFKDKIVKVHTNKLAAKYSNITKNIFSLTRCYITYSICQKIRSGEGISLLVGTYRCLGSDRRSIALCVVFVVIV